MFLLRLRRRPPYRAREPVSNVHVSCVHGSAESVLVVRYLVVQDCPEVLEPDEDTTPLHEICASFNQHLDLLLEVLAISEKAVKAKDELGRTPLHVLSCSSNVTQERFTDSCRKVR